MDKPTLKVKHANLRLTEGYAKFLVEDFYDHLVEAVPPDETEWLFEFDTAAHLSAFQIALKTFAK